MFAGVFVGTDVLVGTGVFVGTEVLVGCAGKVPHPTKIACSIITSTIKIKQFVFILSSF
jgi:hypothetical protein